MHISYKMFKRTARYVLCDVSIIILSYFVGLLLNGFLSAEVTPTSFHYKSILIMTAVSAAVICLIYGIFRIYSVIWLYAGLKDITNVLIADIISVMLNLLAYIVLSGFYVINMNVYAFIFAQIFIVGLSLVSRLIIKVAATYISYGEVIENQKKAALNNVMIIGAGKACDILVREYILNNRQSEIKCIIDDDDEKLGALFHGIRIVGNRSYIKEAIEKYEINEIIFAIPSMSTKEKSDLLELCNKHCKKVKTVPNISEIVDGKFNLSAVKEINVEDLLGREPVRTDLENIMSYVSGKVIAVTGGGGSIGSELCRQIAAYNPKSLIIIDIYENNAYEIQQELLRNYPSLDLHVVIASVRDTQRLCNIFDEYKPNVVYHAAAHKHVPLMENNPHEAIKNNVFGTLKTVIAASKANVEKFVMISTDKAVNPTNIMGATKRICEMIVQVYNKRSKTEFVAVRFGNVLGSNGSVIPLFKKQIEEGGPVTVTHPDIIRYFMTIPEAVSLVLQAGAFAKGGEIFVLDMGKPVKILELAENVIKLSGHVPYKDIDIKFTGLRPGEKLYEELLMSEEGLTATQNELIFIGHPIDIDEKELFNKLGELSAALGDESSDVRKIVKQIVPTYKY